MWSHGSIYWNERMTRDAEATKKFYGDTLGWTYDVMPLPEGTYWVAKMGAAPVAGIFPLTGPEFDQVPEAWFTYIAVDNADARASKMTAAGGAILRGPFDIPEVGRIIIVKDNLGAMFGLMTPLAEP
jgi:predicted enzyme related to lactoylglutathione lyase